MSTSEEKLCEYSTIIVKNRHKLRQIKFHQLILTGKPTTKGIKKKKKNLNWNRSTKMNKDCLDQNFTILELDAATSAIKSSRR